ncbi:MAG: aldehyde ferredoxin oxidoreductase family protein [Candidatus Ranarchaeia archaeon]
MWPGYGGTILDVDLTNLKSKKSPLKEGFARTFIGGRGFGAKMLYDNLKPNTDPFGPENIVVISTGPACGTLWPKGNKLSMVTHSALTDGYSDSQSGGHFAADMKFAGYDIIIIRGKSEKPKILFIDDEHVSFLPAEDIWGRTIVETHNMIREKIGDPLVKTLSIGPAGEKLIRFSCVVADAQRHAGRGGTGAVLGSKKLKGIAIRGSHDVRPANDRFFELCEKAQEKIRDTLGKSSLAERGTTSLTAYSEWGTWMNRNFNNAWYEKAKELDGETWAKKYQIKRHSCYGCVIACGRTSMLVDGPYAGTYTDGPEHETIGLWGGNLAMPSIHGVIKGSSYANTYGCDSISMGNVIGFAIDLFENHIITEEDTDGLILKFGDSDVVWRLAEKIIKREGIGDILAEGVKRAAAKIGRGAEKYAVHIKGLEIPAYDARRCAGQALGFAITDVGGGHGRVWTIGTEINQKEKIPPESTEGKALLVRDSMRSRTFPDIFGMCRFGLFTWEEYADMLVALTGQDFKPEDLPKTCDRVYTITRAFNVPIKGHPEADGVVMTQEKLDVMLDEFYELLGWDKKTGIPTAKALKEYGLEDILSDLRANGIQVPEG